MRSKKFLTLLCLLLVAQIGVASTFVAMSTQEMFEQSENIVQGKVIGLESFWDESGTIIVTEATVRVSESFTGTAGSIVRVRVPGGQVGDFHVVAEGFPALEQGSEVILFLSQRNRNGMQVVGHQQGHFEVVERLDGVTLAVPQIDEDGLYYTRSGQLMAPARSTEIGAFKQMIREGLAERRAQREERGVR